jgi:tRNA pseudouridine13 synthase
MDRLADIENPRAYEPLTCSACFKSTPQDFQVTERLAYTPAAVGEHLYLQVEKVGMETLEVVERLARFYSVRSVDIGYAGRKDKRAVARQWFSIRTTSDLAPAEAHGMRVVGRGRYQRKLRRGEHAGNDFVVQLRGVRGSGWQQRLALVKVRGVPNYFGPQRFVANSARRAAAWLLRYRGGRHGGEGWYLSVLRSVLFNEVLGTRVQAANWQRLIDGDVPACLPETGPLPTGPLWGRGRSAARGAAAEFERQALAAYGEVCRGLERCGLHQDRRGLVLLPRNLRWNVSGDGLNLSFTLGPGGYATSLLREIFVLRGAADGV